MAKVHELADGAEYPMLIDISNTQAVTRQAKSFLASSAPLTNCPGWLKPDQSCHSQFCYDMADTSVFLLAFSPPAVRACPGCSRRTFFSDSDRGSRHPYSLPS
ncbi:hypothetical protein [Pseudarthrobacter oxydans]